MCVGDLRSVCVCRLQAKLAEFKAAGFNVDLEFLDAALIALQGNTFAPFCVLPSFNLFCSSLLSWPPISTLLSIIHFILLLSRHASRLTTRRHFLLVYLSQHQVFVQGTWSREPTSPASLASKWHSLEPSASFLVVSPPFYGCHRVNASQTRKICCYIWILVIFSIGALTQEEGGMGVWVEVSRMGLVIGVHAAPLKLGCWVGGWSPNKAPLIWINIQ